MSQKIAALVGKLIFEVSQSSLKRIQLLPFGRFRSAADNRPTDVADWVLDDTNGFEVAALANATINDIVIDYEHQTLLKEKNGKPAPASGWMKHLEYVPGKGLFADVTWTERADNMIAAKEYRYISAVFTYDSSGKVLKLLHAAITNSPALDGLPELTAACSQFFFKEDVMNEIIKLLRQAFALPNATEQELQVALSALIQSKPKEVALSALGKELADRDTKIATLSAQLSNPGNPDPAKLVPVEVMQQLHQQIAALTAKLNANETTRFINQALADGKLLPAQRAWAENLAAAPDGLAQLTAYLDSMTPIAALAANNSQQSAGAADAAAKKIAALTAADKEAAKMLGYSETEYLNLMKGTSDGAN